MNKTHNLNKPKGNYIKKISLIVGVFAAAISLSARVSTQKVSSVECVRTAPIGKFDERCDEPKLGFKGSFETITVQSGGVSGS